ncbi:MAG: hypothetical protein WAT18_12235 [Sphingorhabdus sp.]
MTSKLKFLVAASTISVALMSSNSAYAVGTLTGTDILNQATVNYNVGAVPQTAETASDTFKVDRKVIFTVAEAATTGTTPVVPGEQNAVTRFQVDNDSNDTLDFDLAVAQLAGGTAEHGGTDNLDVQICTTPVSCTPGVQYFVDNQSSGTIGVYDAGIDTATTIDNLAPDDDIFVFVIGDIALTAPSGAVAGVTLTGTAKNDDGSAITAATDSDANTSAEQTIFADAGRDGIESDGDDYTVTAADLTVTKLSRVVSDGVSVTNPKAIPGAVVEYCIVVSNAGTATGTASSVVVSDDLATLTDVTYVASSGKIDGTVVSGSTCTPGTTNASYTGGANGIVSGTLTDIAPGETRTLVFQVTID